MLIVECCHWRLCLTVAVIAEEKDFILDAFALLGGNENLVSQILERLEEMSYRWRRGTCYNV